MIKRILASLEARLNQPRLSLWRTLYFNFRTLSFHEAIKFPIFIYGRVRFFGLNGKILFENTEIKSGMVKIGINGDSFSLFDHTGYVQLGSKTSILIFEGACRIALNAKIRVQSGTLRIGDGVRIGTDSKIICNGSWVTIGKYTGITFGCTLMNSSFHYTYDTVKKCYCNRSFPIVIGAYNWIGNQTTILSKCKTKDFSIVGTGSLLNRDYTKEDGEYPLLAGRPAKLIRLGVKRVFSPYTEQKIAKLFEEYPNINSIVCNEISDNTNEIKIEM